MSSMQVWTPSARPNWWPSPRQYVSTDSKFAISHGSQLPPIIFPYIKMKLNSLLYFHSGLNSISCYHLRPFLSSYEMIPWNHFTNRSRAHILFFLYFTSPVHSAIPHGRLEFLHQPGHAPLNTLVSLHPQVRTCLQTAEDDRFEFK